MKKIASINIITFLISIIFVMAPSQINSVAGAAQVVVYTPLARKFVELFAEKFKSDTGIKMEYIILPSSEAYARVKFEKGNPRADLLMNVRALYQERGKKEGFIEEYVSPNRKYISRIYSYGDHITPMAMYPLVLVYNVKSVREMKMAPPKSWEDLLEPKWKGKLVLSDPLTSGTAYTFLSMFVQLHRQKGEKGIESKKGWDYVVRVYKSAGQITKSGNAPARLVARGEFPLGFNFYLVVRRLMKAGYPIKPVFPSPIFADPVSVGLIKNGPNPAEARKFIDFLISKSTQEMGVRKMEFYSVRDDVEPPEGAIPLEKLNVFKYDYVAAGKNKKAALRKYRALMK